VVEILDGGQGCRAYTEGATDLHGLVGIAPICVQDHFHIVVLHGKGQKRAAYVESVCQAHSQWIGAICEWDADFTFKTSIFWKSPKDACYTAVSWDRGCNPQAASTRAYKLLKPVKLICF